MKGVREQYIERYEKILPSIVKDINDDIMEILDNFERIDRVSVRPKSVDKFFNKANKKNDDGSLKYTDPLSQIQDQIGARIICFYLQDVQPISDEISKNYHSIEEVDLIPESENEFGYFGKHFVFSIPPNFVNKYQEPPTLFELQIKTLYQHAWSEANHDLAYKAEKSLTTDQK
ncbi:RelA/SpoT domain-containing protein, partial [Fulvivirga sp.]